MWPDGWLRTCVRIRTEAAGTDQYGEPIPGVETRLDLPRCLFSQTPTEYVTTAGVNASITDPTAYWPDEWPDVQVGDRLEIQGTEWYVNGRSQDWPMGLAVTLTAPEGVKAWQSE